MESARRASFDEAERLRHTWVGAEHVLIAVAKDPRALVARDALRACGVDAGAVADYVASMEYIPPEPALEPGQKPSPNPHWYTLCGRAEGFALAAGSEHLLPEHLLLALIWDDHQPSVLTSLLRERGRTPDELQAALVRQGVQVPELTPPVE
jgi:ATP-dependent Clp protease ATP-binding subunit ClpA